MGTGLAACTDTPGGGSGSGGFEKAVGSLTGRTKEGNAPPAVRISENAKLPEDIRPRGGLCNTTKKMIKNQIPS